MMLIGQTAKFGNKKKKRKSQKSSLQTSNNIWIVKMCDYTKFTCPVRRWVLIFSLPYQIQCSDLFSIGLAARLWLCILLHSSDSSIVMQCMPPSFTTPTRCKINSAWSVPVLSVDWFQCKFIPSSPSRSLTVFSKWVVKATILHQ